MDVEILPLLFSENDEQRNEVRSIVMEAMREPEFLDFLVQSLSSIIDDSSSMNNSHLIQVICIVLHEEFKNKEKNTSFFSVNQLELTYKALFEILFKLPFQIRYYILDIFGFFFHNIESFNYEDIIDQCLSIMEQNEYICDNTTALNVIYLWTQYQNKTDQSPNKDEQEQLIERVFPILSSLLDQSLSFLTSIPPELLQEIQESQNQLSSEGQNVLKALNENFDFIDQSSIFVQISYSYDVYIMLDDFKEIMNEFSTILKLDIQNSRSMLNAKKSICELFRKSYFMFKSCDKFSPKSRPFYVSFASEFGPIIIDSVLNCFHVCKDIPLLEKLLNIIYVYLMQHLFEDFILVEEFVTQIIIPASFLTDEDLDTFMEIPDQYIGFNIILEDKDADYMSSIRHRIVKIIEILPEDFVIYLYSFLDQPSSTVIEAEAKNFLKTVVFLYFKSIKPENDLIEQTISEIKENGLQIEEFYYASLLVLLSTMHLNDDWFNYRKEEESLENTNLKDCLEISIFSLLNSDSQVIQIASIDLLCNLIDDKFSIVQSDPNSSLNSLIPLSDVIEAILDLATKIQHKIIGQTLGKLFDVYPNFFLDETEQVIDNYFHLWCNFQYDEDGEKSNSILVNISKIITELPQNCETLFDILQEMTPAVLDALQNPKMAMNGSEQLIDIIGCLSDKIDEPPPDFFMMILSLILETGFNPENQKQDIKNEEEDDDDENDDDFYTDVVLSIRHYSVVICSLICRKNFFDIPEAIDYVIKIIETLFTYDTEISLFASGLVITTTLIQSSFVTAQAYKESESIPFDPDSFLELASKAAEFIHNFDNYNSIIIEDEDGIKKRNREKFKNVKGKELFVLSVIVLSSAIIANEEAIMEMLDEKVIMNWIGYHELIFDVDGKVQFIQWSTIALLILSKYDFYEKGGLLFKVALNQFISIKLMEDDNNDNNDSDDDEYDGYSDFEDDDNDNLFDFHITRFPFNDLVCDKEIGEIQPNDQRFQFLSQMQIDLFLKYIQ